MLPMNVGLIGYGAWGRHHARALAAAPSARLAAIATSGDAAAADFPDAAIHADWQALLDDPAIDAVVVAVPNHLHAEIGVAALDAGKHVLLEKPMALRLAQCDALIEAAARAGRVLTIGHELRVSTQWGRMGTLIAEGAIGRPQAVHITLFRFPYRQGSGGWRYDSTRVGSWLLEEAVHHADLALWWLRDAGLPAIVHASAVGPAYMARSLSATLEFPGGELATFNLTVGGFEHHLAVTVMGEGGAIRALWSAAMDRAEESQASLALFRGRAAPGERATPIAFDRSGEIFELETQAEAAIQGFRQGRALVTPQEGRAAVAVCLLAERSAREGRALAWREAEG
jgi:myo-inositol 2-dehydrogenase/D-chiro-inositol 1-dehydrogenase